MAMNTRDSTCLPLQEKTIHNRMIARAIELVILSLLVSMLVYRVVSFKDQDHQYLPWLLGLLCESWFTFIWILLVCVKWNQCSFKTYPERLLKRISESELPAVDVFITTVDPVLEPPIITMNTVLSLLAVDYPSNKLAIYLSDDSCSPLTCYSLVQTTKFAKVWVPFCKRYNVQVRAPFQYFNSKSTPLENSPMEFQKEWVKMKNEYAHLYKKIKQSSFPCDLDTDFSVFSGVHRSSHPAIIKVISENKEGIPSDLPHIVYISREKSPKYHHRYKAGAMNVLARVSGVMTNAPLMLNVDCDMYANNPQVFLHAMCMLFGFKNEEDCGFVQFFQDFYDGLKDDPFGNHLTCLGPIVLGISTLQGCFYGGTNCFHRRKVIYGSSPNDSTKIENMSNGDLHKIFGKSIELRETAAQILSGSNSKIENQRSPSSYIQAAIQVAGCSYECGTSWGSQVGWMYGSSAEDILTGLAIHGQGWKSTIVFPHPTPFLGCAAVTYPSAMTQQKRWATGVLEILFTNKNPLLLTLKGKLWFRQALAYIWFCTWSVRSVPELCYAALPAYCIFTNSHFFPKINEPAIIIPLGIIVIYNLYVLWESIGLGLSLCMWWNLQRMGRVNTMTSWFFAYLSGILKLLGLGQIVFEVTRKGQGADDSDDDANAGTFTYDKSPMIIPGVTILLVNLTALVSGVFRLRNVDSGGNWSGVGEMFCSVCVCVCFWEFLKGLFKNGKYGIPSSTILKSGALVLLFVLFCRRSSQWV